jgi:quinol monooxygenase YgiN
MSNNSELSLYLLSIRGTLASPTLEAARQLHNETAGAPANVAAAQSLGDLVHLVYTPLGENKPGAGEFLILDVWKSMDGLNQFFSNPQVQHQAGQIFSQRDPVVWGAAEGFVGYNLPAPSGRNERIVSIVRGMLPSVEKGREIHNAGSIKMLSQARKAGNISHEAYLRMAAPGSPEPLEFFAVDVWSDHDGMHTFYDLPEFMQGLDGLFTAEPDFSVWAHPAGTWVEW